MRKPAPYKALVLEPGASSRRARFAAPPRSAETPLISCMMPTRGHAFPARFAIGCFQAQSYPNRELVVLCQTPDNAVKRLIEEIGDPAIRYFDAEGAATVGDMRNAAVARCRGDFVAIWDDDDLYGTGRLALQMGALAWAKATACFLSREILWWPAREQLAGSRIRAWENSMLVERDALPAYPSLVQGEDTAVTEQLLAAAKTVIIDGPPQYVRIYHGQNVCDAAHFDAHFKAAARNVAEDAYSRILDRLAADFPMREYAAALASRP